MEITTQHNPNENFVETSIVKGYHAHVYFDQESLDQAQSLCLEAGRLFPVEVGRFHQKPIGPHPCWSCQLKFSQDNHTQIITWLSLNRNRLNVLIHPLTGNDLLDHTDYAAWLGEPQALNLAVLK